MNVNTTVVFSLLICFLSCCSPKLDEPQAKKRSTMKTIEQVLSEYTDELMSIEGVVGTAIGEVDGNPCILVLVEQKTEETVKKIPEELEGYPVVISEVGEIRPL